MNVVADIQPPICDRSLVYLEILIVIANLFLSTISTISLLQSTRRRTNRTFLSWLHFAVVLGGLAVGLLNFGDKVGKISAAMYTIIGQYNTTLSSFLTSIPGTSG